MTASTVAEILWTDGEEFFVAWPKHPRQTSDFLLGLHFSTPRLPTEGEFKGEAQAFLQALVSERGQDLDQVIDSWWHSVHECAEVCHNKLQYEGEVWANATLNLKAFAERITESGPAEHHAVSDVNRRLAAFTLRQDYQGGWSVSWSAPERVFHGSVGGYNVTAEISAVDRVHAWVDHNAEQGVPPVGFFYDTVPRFFSEKGLPYSADRVVVERGCRLDSERSTVSPP